MTSSNAPLLLAVGRHLEPLLVFLGTKWEAFHGRGEGDFLSSPDLEDILAVVARRPEIVEETLQSNPELRSYLGAQMNWFLDQEAREYAIQSAIPDAGVSPAIVDRVLDRMAVIADEAG